MAYWCVWPMGWAVVSAALLSPQSMTAFLKVAPPLWVVLKEVILTVRLDPV